jgi:uncharacterized protein
VTGRGRGLDLTPAVPGGRQLIEAYRPGGFRIAGVQHAGSVLVLPERTLRWPVAVAADITAASLAGVAAAAPAVELLILGLGPRFGLIDAGLRAALRGHGIVIEAMATDAACRTYNLLLTEGRRVAAALIAL